MSDLTHLVTGDRFDRCACGHLRGDHEGAQPQPCEPPCPCIAFVGVSNAITEPRNTPRAPVIRSHGQIVAARGESVRVPWSEHRLGDAAVITCEGAVELLDRNGFMEIKRIAQWPVTVTVYACIATSFTMPAPELKLDGVAILCVFDPRDFHWFGMPMASMPALSAGT